MFILAVTAPILSHCRNVASRDFSLNTLVIVLVKLSLWYLKSMHLMAVQDWRRGLINFAVETVTCDGKFYAKYFFYRT